ncbi:hypothetical protein BKA70DRAFT_1222311 [Coprinopsis sp. MPI-PUGE-AT-0042]|nr:hypothetical protein BKA70DRAFT_1222311 [Coprinopsis sp. MPI-PUGE-AT-0042]
MSFGTVTTPTTLSDRLQCGDWRSMSVERIGLGNSQLQGFIPTCEEETSSDDSAMADGTHESLSATASCPEYLVTSRVVKIAKRKCKDLTREEIVKAKDVVIQSQRRRIERLVERVQELKGQLHASHRVQGLTVDVLNLFLESDSAQAGPSSWNHQHASDRHEKTDVFRRPQEKAYEILLGFDSIHQLVVHAFMSEKRVLWGLSAKTLVRKRPQLVTPQLGLAPDSPIKGCQISAKSTQETHTTTYQVLPIPMLTEMGHTTIQCEIPGLTSVPDVHGISEDTVNERADAEILGEAGISKFATDLERLSKDVLIEMLVAEQQEVQRLRCRLAFVDRLWNETRRSLETIFAGLER